MDEQPKDLAEEIRHLQRCINDLVSVLALPAMWSGAEPSQIIQSLLEALLRVLQLDLVYVRLKETGGQLPIEMARFTRSQAQFASGNQISELLQQWLATDTEEWPQQMRNRLGDRDISIVPMGLGLQGELGVIVAGSERTDFPRQTERLILSVAANQASIGLQEARLLSEQKRIASELDGRVAQRTRELGAANEELRKEVSEREEIEKRLLDSENLLKTSEAKLWEMINTIPTIAWFCLPDGANEFHNDRWTEYTGLSRGESTGSGWRVAYHPEDLPRLIKRRQEYMSSGEPGEIQARIRRFDGVYRWFLIRAEPFRDESGNILRWYGTNTDIHDRKLVQDELQRSGEQYRLVVETASDAIVSMDESGVIIFANAATKGIFGYEPAELIGKSLTVLMPTMMRQPHENGFRRYIATGHRHINWQGTELTALRKNGHEFPVEVSFGELIRDGHRVFTGLMRDISERKQAEHNLRASERSLRELTETIPQLLWSAEADGTVNYCNRRTLEYTGLSAEEVRESGWLTAVHPEDGEKATRAWLSSVRSGEAFQCEFRFRQVRDGYRWCISNAVPLRDVEGKVIRWFGTVVDLHDWREAQQALHAIQARQVAVRGDVSLAFGQKESLDAILHECAESMVRHLDATFARIWTLSHDGKMLELRASAGMYTHLNGAHSRIPFGELKIGTIAREQKHVLSNDIINDPRISDKTWAANEGMSSFAGYPMLMGTRTLGVVAMFSRKPLQTGTAEALASIADLIAHGIERKHAEEKLRASERDLSLIIETIPGLVWCAAPDGELNHLNRRILDYTGTTPDAWAQLGWTNFLHPDDVERTVRSWSGAVASGEQYDTQCRLRRSDGVYRWFQCLGQPSYDNEGEVTRWYGLLIDIDDRKIMEEALRGSEMRLSRATRAATVGEFAASIAHEINQPLAAVVANGHACLRWLSAGPPGVTKAQEAAERIIRDGKEAAEVVRRIRALFKKAAIEKMGLELNEVIAEVLHLLSSETAKRRVAVEIDLADDLPPVVGDRVQLQQLTFNLLLNGIEAMDPVVDRPRKLLVRSKRHNPETVLVEIQDSGVGIEDSEKVFESFFTTKENGMGMGLAVCRSIIDAHHGRLWAASGNGEGTTFSFTLPVQSSSAS